MRGSGSELPECDDAFAEKVMPGRGRYRGDVGRYRGDVGGDVGEM